MLLQRQQSRAPSRMPQKYFESQEVLPPTLLLSQLSGAAKGIILFVYLTASLSRLNRLTRVSPTRKQTRGNKLKQTDRRSTARWGWAGPYRPSSSTPACAGCPPPQAAHGLGHRHRAPTAPASSAAASPPPGKQRAPHLAPKPHSGSNKRDMGSSIPASSHSLKSNFCDNEKPCGAAGRLLMDAAKGGSKPIFTASFIACRTQAAPSTAQILSWIL